MSTRHDFSDLEKYFPTYSDGQTLFVQHDRGTPTSVTRDHFCTYVIEWRQSPDSGSYPAREPDGCYRLVLGYEIVTEDQARKANPGLFGAADPYVLHQMTREEKRAFIEDQRTKKELEAAFEKSLREAGL